MIHKRSSHTDMFICPSYMIACIGDHQQSHTPYNLIPRVNVPSQALTLVVLPWTCICWGDQHPLIFALGVRMRPRLKV